MAAFSNILSGEIINLKGKAKGLQTIKTYRCDLPVYFICLYNVKKVACTMKTNILTIGQTAIIQPNTVVLNDYNMERVVNILQRMCLAAWASRDIGWWASDVSPSGDLAQGLVIMAVYQGKHPALDQGLKAHEK